MPVSEQFAEYAVRQLRNYGVCVTSRMEGSHGQIKSILKQRNGNLRDLHGATKEQHERRRDAYNEKLHDSQAGMPVPFLTNQLYQVIRGRVSRQALKQIQRQEKLAKDALSSGGPPTSCSGMWAQQMGLPCSHVIRHKLEQEQMLELREVDRHWYIWPDGAGHDADEDVLRHIQDPRIRPRRRPNLRRYDASTARDRSHDELPARRRQPRQQQPQQQPQQPPQQPAPERRCGRCRNVGHNQRTCTVPL